MVDAFVMVKTGAGRSESVVAEIRDLEGVSEAHVVAGDYDIMAEITAEEVYDVLQTASSAIQDLDGVTGTRTYIALD